MKLTFYKQMTRIPLHFSSSLFYFPLFLLSLDISFFIPFRWLLLTLMLQPLKNFSFFPVQARVTPYGPDSDTLPHLNGGVSSAIVPEGPIA